MDLRNINNFVVVAEAGSLRSAAKILGVTQPALTKAVRRLEDEAGVAFFVRQSRGVSLTNYGQSFLRHARALNTTMADARNELEALKSGTAGRIRLGAGPSWQSRVLPQAIAMFRQEWPGVQVEIHGGLDHSLKADLRRGSLDLVVAAMPEGSEDPDLDGRALMVDEYHVVACKDHPLRKARDFDYADLLNYPWVLPSPLTYMVKRLEVIMRSRGLPPPRPSIETDIVPLKLSFMRGSEYLSFHAIEHLRSIGEHDIQALPFEGLSWKRQAGIITRHGVIPNAAASNMSDTIERVCRENAVGEPIQITPRSRIEARV